MMPPSPARPPEDDGHDCARPTSEVSDCDAVRSEDVVDADEGGTRSNAPAITTLSLIGEPLIGERGAATTAMSDARPAQNIALTCDKKLERLTLGSAKSTVT